MTLKNRKSTRLKNYDYSTTGAYFLTICTKHRKNILSKIYVGTDFHDCPKIELSKFGNVADKYINQLNKFYDNISLDNYVIMPNHIHLLISINNDGQSRTPVPTNTKMPSVTTNSERTPTSINQNINSIIASFVSTFKRFCNKEFNINIWQNRYYDHIIRCEEDYNEIWKYIDNNPFNWQEDELYN